VKPEAADYLVHAIKSMDDARGALAAGLARLAAREAYVSSLNAAREKLNKASKTHSGTRGLVHQLVREGLAVDQDALEVLSEGFNVKTHADYGPYQEVGEAQASELVRRAERFLTQIQAALGD
jgi:uncharacterized protein (UPF0332 family)